MYQMGEIMVIIQLTFEKKLNKVNACKDPGVEDSQS